MAKYDHKRVKNDFGLFQECGLSDEIRNDFGAVTFIFLVSVFLDKPYLWS